MKKTTMLMLVLVAGCHNPDPRQVNVLDREIATMTSVALTVDRDDKGNPVDRTPAQKKAIADKGAEMHGHLMEVTGQ